ncbi:hypothetical protein [Hungatella sp.]|uniref:hypothetical protein n=1 Tax=Hungatella sp. TaxID=2613924 RepID=UPI002A7F8999|nr:hypothetical protein [Hungatella sp.]
MSGRIIAGEFDAEKYWEDRTAASLPSVKSGYYDRVVESMDELLIAYSGDGEDILITKNPLDSDFQGSLERFGIRCRNYTYEQFETSVQAAEKSILDTYAVTDKYISFSEQYGLRYPHPAVSIIKKVNSKFYSVELSKRLGMNEYSRLIDSWEELIDQLDKLLKAHEKLMIKAEYSVSGKGNMVIDQNSRDRFLSLTRRQAEKGKHIRYVVEPLFCVEKDFSSQWNISETGDIRKESVQEILNHGSSYGGSADAGEQMTALLEKENYFIKLEQLCCELYRDGYYGDVCVDSMLLKGGELVPVVEINARKSMSLTKARFDQLFDKNGYRNRVSCMLSKDISYRSDLTFPELSEALADCGIGYDRDRKCGIIPVTCNTLFANRDLSREQSRGRLYCYATAENRSQLESLFERLNKGNIRLENGKL